MSSLRAMFAHDSSAASVAMAAVVAVAAGQHRRTAANWVSPRWHSPPLWYFAVTPTAATSLRPSAHSWHRRTLDKSKRYGAPKTHKNTI